MRWQDRGACNGADPDLFFPERGDPTGPAKRICERCPVKKECLEFALSDPETVGVWGGTSGAQRRQIRRADGGGRRVAACGTDSGYYAHRRRSEPACQACKDEHSAAERRRAAA